MTTSQPFQLSSLGRLTGLALHVLACIPHALALVGLGLADLADVGRHLADRLLVDTAHGDARRNRHFEGHAVGRVDDHGMAEAEGELDLPRTTRGSAVADADDL